MDQLRLSPMQQHELTMRQMVQQIHLGKLNMDQAAAQFNVNRKTVRHWVDKVEKEAQTNPETVSELPDLPPLQKKTATPHVPSSSEDQNELRAKVHALEQELEVAKFKALYYSTIVKVAEQELGVDIEKKSVTAPAARQAIRFMLMNYPTLHIRQLEGWPLRRSDWFFTTSLLSILAAPIGSDQ